MNVQLPDSASLERTDRVMRKIEKIGLATPGIRHVAGIAGQSFVLNASGSNFGSLFVNFGGPGPQMLTRLPVRAYWDWVFSPEIRAKFDLKVFMRYLYGLGNEARTVYNRIGIVVQLLKLHGIEGLLKKGDKPKYVENIREIKTRFSRYVKDLPKTGSVLITKNGRPCAALVPVTEDTDLEALALSQNKRFWKVIDDAIARGKKEGFVGLSEL